MDVAEPGNEFLFTAVCLMWGIYTLLLEVYLQCMEVQRDTTISQFDIKF